MRPGSKHFADGCASLATTKENIVIEYRYAEGKLERLPDLAAEMVQLKVDVIVTTGAVVSTSKKASATIPIGLALRLIQ